MSRLLYLLSEQSSQNAQNISRALIYYCDFCDEILLISRHVVNEYRVLFAFNNICPKCEVDLTTSMRCSLTPIQSDEEIHVNARGDAGYLIESKKTLKPDYQRLSLTLQPQLSTGIAGIDDLTQFKLGQLVVLSGSRTCHWLSELLCVRAQLPRPIGLGSSTVFLDGGNSYDPYLISKFAIEHGLQPNDVLRDTRVSRAFTCYQMSYLIHTKLLAELTLTDARLVVASDLMALYCDSELAEKCEGKRIFQKAVARLSQVAKTNDVLIVATLFSMNDRALEDYALHVCDVYLDILEDKNSIKAELRRHRLKPEERKHILDHDNTTLDEFLG